MRHTACYMVLLAALLVACSEDRTDSGKAVVQGSEGTVTFAARDGFDTRTALDGTRVVWEQGDGVGIFCPQIAEAANYRATIADTDDGQSSATLTTGLRYASGEHTFYAYYPHTEQSGVDASTTTVTGLLASGQDGDTGKNGFMWATTTATPGTDPITLQFRHPFTYLDIQLRSSGEFLGAAVRSISIRAAEGKTLAGSFTADLTSGEVTFTDPVAEVTTSSPVTALTDAYQETFAVINAEDLTGTDVTVSVTLERDEQLYEFWKSLPGRQFNPQTKTNLKLTIEEMDHDITFADATVESLCVANWDLDGDGKLSTDEAAAVSDLGTVFYSQTKITSFDELQFFTGISEISNKAFSSCSALTSVILPEQITAIGNDAFSYCSKLTSMNLPSSIVSIGYSAFERCTALSSISLSENLASIGNSAFERCTSLTSIVIPDKVTTLGESIFKECSKLEDVTLGKGLTETGKLMFQTCTALKKIELPENIRTIGYQSFFQCSGFTEFTIPETVTEIGFGAFFECTYLTHLTIPASVTVVGEEAFKSCIRLTSLDIRADLTAIPRQMAYNCSSLNEIAWPESVQEIGTEAFRKAAFTELSLPEGITKIEQSAFRECKQLTNISIPASVTAIDGYAFYNCPALADVYCKPTTPPTLGAAVFYNVPGTIHVPSGSVDSYKAATNWSNYEAQIAGYDF